jgi:serine/threonine protein kinase
MSGQTPGNLWAALQDVHVDGPEVDAMNAFVRLETDSLRVVASRRGGMGEVFICESLSKDSEQPPARFALKTFQKKYFFDSSTRIAFLQEATIWARLTGCLHVMPNLGMTSIDQRPAVCMLAIEPRDGEPVTVADMLRVGALPPEEALAVALQTALGMHEATTRIPGLIHGDLKPENLLVKRGTVWITDFGLARVFDPKRGVFPLQSTYNYQAPEIFDKPEAATPKADIYSFGLLLYELLTGRRPVDASDRTFAAEAHRTLNLAALRTEGRDQRYLALGSKAALVEALSRVAISCATREPADRPPDFAAVFDALREIAGVYDLVGYLDRVMQWRQQKAVLVDVQRNAAPALMHLLIELNKFQAALALVEDLGVDTLSPALIRLRGVALVLSGDVEEGLAIFEDLLRRADIPAYVRRNTEMERALALKRLDRFEEAVAIFERLLSDADDADLPSIVTNLATVYLRFGDFRAAKKLLDPFCSRHSEHAHAWLNLGTACAWLGDADRALKALDRATALNSSLEEAYLVRAAVQMDLLNRPDLAYTSLDMAFDQGFNSRAWAVRMVVAATIIGRTGAAKQILKSLEKNLSERVFDEIKTEINALFADLRDETPRSKPRYQSFLRRAEPTKSAPLTGLASQPQPQGTDNHSAEFRMPFMNTRFYASDGSFSIDFYYPLEAPNYVERFREGLDALRRQMAIGGLGSHLRTTPFFVTRCASCGVEIMTNRDPGKRIQCRCCGVSHSCDPVGSPRAQELASTLLDNAVVASDGRKLEYLALGPVVIRRPFRSRT